MSGYITYKGEEVINEQQKKEENQEVIKKTKKTVAKITDQINHL